MSKAKLNLSFKETGRLTLYMFNKLYEHYKTNFDIEMRLYKSNTTYSEAFIKAQEDEEWF